MTALTRWQSVQKIAHNLKMSFNRNVETDEQSERKQKIRKIYNERFEHLYDEKIFHINFYSRNMNLFSINRLMKDLRDSLSTDGRIQFEFNVMNVPIAMQLKQYQIYSSYFYLYETFIRIHNHRIIIVYRQSAFSPSQYIHSI